MKNLSIILIMGIALLTARCEAISGATFGQNDPAFATCANSGGGAAFTDNSETQMWCSCMSGAVFNGSTCCPGGGTWKAVPYGGSCICPTNQIWSSTALSCVTGSTGTVKILNPSSNQNQGVTLSIVEPVSKTICLSPTYVNTNTSSISYSCPSVAKGTTLYGTIAGTTPTTQFAFQAGTENVNIAPVSAQTFNVQSDGAAKFACATSGGGYTQSTCGPYSYTAWGFINNNSTQSITLSIAEKANPGNICFNGTILPNGGSLSYSCPSGAGTIAQATITDSNATVGTPFTFTAASSYSIFLVQDAAGNITAGDATGNVLGGPYTLSTSAVAATTPVTSVVFINNTPDTLSQISVGGGCTALNPPGPLLSQLTLAPGANTLVKLACNSPFSFSYASSGYTPTTGNTSLNFTSTYTPVPSDILTVQFNQGAVNLFDKNWNLQTCNAYLPAPSANLCTTLSAAQAALALAQNKVNADQTAGVAQSTLKNDQLALATAQTAVANLQKRPGQSCNSSNKGSDCVSNLCVQAGPNSSWVCGCSSPEDPLYKASNPLSPCPPGYACSSYACFNPKTVANAGTNKAVGDPCYENTQCSSNFCSNAGKSINSCIDCTPGNMTTDCACSHNTDCAFQNCNSGRCGTAQPGTLNNYTPFALQVSICGQTIQVPTPTSMNAPGTATYVCPTILSSQSFQLSLASSPSNSVINSGINAYIQGTGTFDTLNFVSSGGIINAKRVTGNPPSSQLLSNPLTVCPTGYFIGNSSTGCFQNPPYPFNTYSYGQPYGWADVTSVVQSHAGQTLNINPNDLGLQGKDPFPGSTNTLVAMINGFTIPQIARGGSLQVPANANVAWAYYGAGCTSNNNGYNCPTGFACTDSLPFSTPGYTVNGKPMLMLNNFCVAINPTVLAQSTAISDRNYALAHRGQYRSRGGMTASQLSACFNDPTCGLMTVLSAESIFIPPLAPLVAVAQASILAAKVAEEGGKDALTDALLGISAIPVPGALGEIGGAVAGFIADAAQAAEDAAATADAAANAANAENEANAKWAPPAYTMTDKLQQAAELAKDAVGNVFFRALGIPESAGATTLTAFMDAASESDIAAAKNTMYRSPLMDTYIAAKIAANDPVDPEIIAKVMQARGLPALISASTLSALSAVSSALLTWGSVVGSLSPSLSSSLQTPPSAPSPQLQAQLNNINPVLATCTAGQKIVAASSTGGLACTACPAGLTSQAGRGFCTCPAGTIDTTPIDNVLAPLDPSVCQPCPSNATCPMGPLGPVAICNANYYSNGTSCVICPGGGISPAGSTSSSACTCPAGYSTSSGSGSCQQCPINTYSTAANSSSCTKCATGATSPAGSPSAAACVCPANSSIQGGACQCKANTYATTTAGILTCTNCPTGATSPAGSTSCACPINTYATTTAGILTCNNCPTGTTSPAGSPSAAACVCPAGFSKMSNGSCQQCAINTYAPAGSSTCTPCSAGQFSAAGATACTACPAGQYSATAGSGCKTCLPGGVSSAAGATSCTQCLAGTGPNSTTTSCIPCTGNTGSANGSGCVANCSGVTIMPGGRNPVPEQTVLVKYASGNQCVFGN